MTKMDKSLLSVARMSPDFVSGLSYGKDYPSFLREFPSRNFPSGATYLEITPK